MKEGALLMAVAQGLTLAYEAMSKPPIRMVEIEDDGSEGEVSA